MVDPVPKEQAAPILEGDRAEVDLPVAGRVLGGESLFLQVSCIPVDSCVCGAENNLFTVRHRVSGRDQAKPVNFLL